MALKKRLALFLAEFEHQISEIDNIYSRINQRLDILERKDVSVEIVESTGYWLHNLYCAFEDLFKIVAGFWENDVGADVSFHIQLLKRMQVKVNGIRPALISKESFDSLNELRGFRHVFRHAYSYGLNDQRVLSLVRQVLEKKNLIMRDLLRFKKDIESIE